MVGLYVVQIVFIRLSVQFEENRLGSSTVPNCFHFLLIIVVSTSDFVGVEIVICYIG